MRGMSGVGEVQFVRQSLYRDRFDERIGDDHFILAERRGVAVESRLRVCPEQFSNSRQTAEELKGQRVRHRSPDGARISVWRGVFQALRDLGFQPHQHAMEKRVGYAANFGELNGLFVEESGKQQAQQIGGDAGDRLSGRQVLAIHVIDAARQNIGSHQTPAQVGHRQ